MARSPNNANQTIHITPIKTGLITIGLVGTSPMLHNCMSAKRQLSLFAPETARRDKKSERAAAPKHDPLIEFADSIRRMGPDAPTLIAIPSTAPKKAAAQAALDLPGATKSAIGRQLHVVGYSLPIWGPVNLSTMMVKTGSFPGVPDVRTRAIQPRWATAVTLQFVQPILTAEAVANLFAAAGFLCGIGDGRPEKGSLDFGQFRVCDPNTDAEFLDIVANHGREQQIEDMLTAAPFDAETSDLLAAFFETGDTRVTRELKRSDVVGKE